MSVLSDAGRINHMNAHLPKITGILHIPYQASPNFYLYLYVFFLTVLRMFCSACNQLFNFSNARFNNPPASFLIQSERHCPSTISLQCSDPPRQTVQYSQDVEG